MVLLHEKPNRAAVMPQIAPCQGWMDLPSGLKGKNGFAVFMGHFSRVKMKGGVC